MGTQTTFICNMVPIPWCLVIRCRSLVLYPPWPPKGYRAVELRNYGFPMLCPWSCLVRFSGTFIFQLMHFLYFLKLLHGSSICLFLKKYPGFLAKKGDVIKLHNLDNKIIFYKIANKHFKEFHVHSYDDCTLYDALIFYTGAPDCSSSPKKLIHLLNLISVMSIHLSLQ